MTVNTDKLNATLTLNTQHKFFGERKTAPGASTIRPY